MHSSSKLFIVLLVSVIITFSWIGYTYYSQNSTSPLFIIELGICIALLVWLFIHQKQIYRRVIDEMTQEIESDWLQGLFSNFPAGMLILDKTGRVLFANEIALSFFELTREEIRQAELVSLFNEKAYEFYLESIQDSDVTQVWKDEFQLENQ